MAQFNLNDYETVEQRIARFYKAYPEGRILTEDYTTAADREKNVWRVKAYIYKTADQVVVSTGHAFEIDGTGMANKTSALENAETSAIGRALANMGMHGNKRASREEMQKVARAQTPANAALPDYLTMLAQVTTIDQARELYVKAQRNAPQDVLDEISRKASTLK
jgi:hypothetical protein